MLGLAIGITTAMFTVVDALILRPVPFRDPERLAQMYMGTDRGGRTVVAPAVLSAWRASPAFEAAEGANPGLSLLETDAGITTRPSARITRGLLPMLGVRPIRGRLFDEGDGRAGDRVLISEDLWRTLLDADPGVIGRRITVDTRPMTIVGVLPGEFRFPAWNTVIWTSIDYDAPPPWLAKELPRPYVRFAAGVPLPDALRAATDAAQAADGATAKLKAIAYPMAGLRVDPYYERAIPLLAGGVFLVFLVLCANVSSLLLARLTARGREFGMCAALGASRARLLRQAMLESAALGLIGALAGVSLAWALVSLSRSYLPEAFLLRTLNPVNLDLRALGIATAAALLATVAAGLLPALIGTRARSASSLREVERSGTESRGARALTRTLLVVEVALACTLLVGATLLVRSFTNLSREDRAIDAAGVLSAQVGVPADAFPTPAATQTMADRLVDEMRAIPGVQQVAWSYGTPPDGGAFRIGDWQPDTPGAAPITMRVESYHVGPDFFALYGIPLLRGRTFASSDAAADVVVGEWLATALWPGEDPVGRSFSFDTETMRVIGMVRETHFPGLDPRENNPEFYRPFARGSRERYASLNIRCGAACPDVAVIRQRLVATHPAVMVYDVAAVERAYLEALARPRAAAVLGFAFAAIAIAAAAGGLFSILTYAVGRRRREFGIRTALGASPRRIRRLVLRDAAGVAVTGVALGAAGAWLLARSLSALQYGVSVGDPISWAVVLAFIAMTTIAASWRPAQQATRADPASLLRE
jgi:putative ABC transport system permease protein